ncbi:MAG: precorrin-6A/cobalt-precorrin-6A reductase, partial [Lachnospiraceae bacterium]|nr:precorrin-6A/cobalt-precorrin-6A reductase [Lachnospiraceae bacterium]
MIYKKKIVVFAGTTEGRLLAERLAASGVEVIACVATEYGEKLMPEQSCLQVHSGRMDAEEMADFLQRKMPHLVVDATHPYAQVVSETVKKVCEELHMEYVRLLRPAGAALPEDARIHIVEDAKAAARLAEQMSGNIFLTTGSKELAVFVETITDFSRLYARVLST